MTGTTRARALSAITSATIVASAFACNALLDNGPFPADLPVVDGGNDAVEQQKDVAIAPGADPAISIVAGSNHTCVLRAQGDVLCWGDNTRGQLGREDVAKSHTPVRVEGL